MIALALLLGAIDASPVDVRLDGRVELSLGETPGTFTPLTAPLNNGISGQILWVRFTLENPTDAALVRWLEIDNPTLDRIELHDGAVRRTGRAFPANQRELMRPSFAFRVELAAHEQRTLMLRIESDNEQIVPLGLWDQTALAEKDALYARISGGLFGVLLTMLLLNLFLFLFLRERSYLFYAGAVAFNAAWIYVLDGSLGMLFPDQVIARAAYLVPSFIANTATYFFMREMLELSATHRRLDRAFAIYFFVGAGLVFLLSLASWRVQNIASSIFIPLNVVFYVAFAVRRLRQGFRSAVWIVLAWSVLLGSLLLIVAVLNGLLNFGFSRLLLHTGLAIEVGMAAEAVLLSLALADAARRRNQHIGRLQEAGGRFVPTEFLSLLGKKELPDVAQGDQIERELSVFFLDIRSFTPLVEGMSPKDTIALVNAIFANLEPAITAQGGFIDKFIGDAVMALFERPDGAVRAAVGCTDALRAFNVGRSKPVAIGIGVHTGRVVLGTVGGAKRLSCTVIGDTVNLASRLEGLTKAYGVDVLISDATAAAIAGAVAVRRLDRVGVKGRVQPLDVYDVIEGSPEKAQTAVDFEAGRVRYAQGDFDAAQVLLETCVQRAPGDHAAAVLLERCRAYAKAPPATGWDGVVRY